MPTHTIILLREFLTVKQILEFLNTVKENPADYIDPRHKYVKWIYFSDAVLKWFIVRFEVSKLVPRVIEEIQKRM